MCRIVYTQESKCLFLPCDDMQAAQTRGLRSLLPGPLPHMVSFTRFFPILDIPFSAPPALGETVFRPHACQSAHTLSQLPSSKVASFVPRYSVHLCLLSFSFLLAAAPVHRSTTSPGPRSRRPKNQKPSAASSVSPSKRSDAHLSRANCSLHATGKKPMAVCYIRPP